MGEDVGVKWTCFFFFEPNIAKRGGGDSKSRAIEGEDGVGELDGRS